LALSFFKGEQIYISVHFFIPRKMYKSYDIMMPLGFKYFYYGLGPDLSMFYYSYIYTLQ